MLNFRRLVLSLVLFLAILCPATATFAGAYEDIFSSDYAQHQQTAREQREARERENTRQLEMESQRSQNQLKQWRDQGTGAFNPNRSTDSDISGVNGYSGNGVFFNCYGSSTWKTCSATGGNK